MLQHFLSSPTSQIKSKQKLKEFQYKDKSQLKTEVPSQPEFKKKITLECCSSSISLQQKNHFEKERKLFCRYLFQASQKKRQRLYLHMEKDYKSRIQSKDYSDSQGKQSQIIHLNLIKYDGTNDLQTKIMNHYIGAWILSMGYEDITTMKYFLSKCYSLIGNDQLSKYERFYKNLGDPYLNKKQRIQFLINLCKNGWQYFFMEMVKSTKKSRTEYSQINNSSSTIYNIGSSKPNTFL